MRARAAEHGLDARELKTLVRGRARAPEAPDTTTASAELTGAGGLTEKQNTFARREAVMAWAAAHGQGAPARAVEHAAAEFLTRDDVHRAPDPSGRRFTTSDLLAHKQAIVVGAQAHRGEGTGRLDSALVEAVLASAPFAPTAEQARVIHGLTSSGHGVETVEALAGTGKTFTAGLLAQAYTAGGSDLHERVALGKRVGLRSVDRCSDDLDQKARDQARSEYWHPSGMPHQDSARIDCFPLAWTPLPAPGALIRTAARTRCD